MFVQRPVMSDFLSAATVCAVLMGAMGATAPTQAAVISTVGVYDEQMIQPNTVDFSATFDANLYEIGLGTFKREVASAWLAGTGAVIDFEAGGPGGTTRFQLIEARYAAGTKTLSISDTRHADGNYAGPGAMPGRTPISGTKLLGNYDRTFVFDFDPNSEPVVAAGFTVMSRDHTSFPAMFQGTAYFSGGGSHSALHEIGNVPGAGDTFFGFRAPEGERITGLTARPVQFVGGEWVLSSVNSIAGVDDLAFITPAQAGHTLSTVGVYDEQTTQPNTVNFSATVDANPNEISYTTFKNQVEAAWLKGTGAVVDFETGGPGSSGSYGLIKAEYDSGDKILNIADPAGTYRGPHNYAGRTPISGTKFLGSDTPPFVFNFPWITDADGNWLESEYVAAAGFTVLSREERPANEFPAMFEATAYFSGGGSHSVLHEIGDEAGTGDTFFGFRAPGGEAITGLIVQPVEWSDATSSWVPHSVNIIAGIDDFGFIAVPEPGSALLLLAAALSVLLAAGRRRAAWRGQRA